MEGHDPWLSNVENIIPTPLHKCEFEDNFIDNSNKLPDSEQYLAALERKLSKLKKSGGSTKSDQQNLLSSLETSRESCMYRLITGETRTDTNEDIDLNASVNVNSTTGWLKSHVNPEQPLTVGELVQLVKADYLANQTQEEVELQPVEEKPI